MRTWIAIPKDSPGRGEIYLPRPSVWVLADKLKRRISQIMIVARARHFADLVGPNTTELRVGSP